MPGPGLTDDVKQHLRNIAASNSEASDTDLDAFIALVDTSVANYWATKSVQDQALPAIVRGDLKAAHEASLKLGKRANALGGTSRHLLYAKESGGDGERFREALRHIVRQLARARADAEQLSRSGAPRGYAKTILAAMVAHAIETRLAVKPMITRGGVFEDVLKTVIGAVEKREDPSVRDLMRAAMKARVHEAPDGVIEIEPWVE